MLALRPIPTPVHTPVPVLSAGVVGRLYLTLGAFLALVLLTAPLLAAEPLAAGSLATGSLATEPAGTVPRLRGDVTARGDVIALGDLVEGVPPALAARPLFRAPALGAVGTIQAGRVVEAALRLGLPAPETGGRTQVTVQRAARRVGTSEIEAALVRALETVHGLDGRLLSVRLEGGEPPTLLAPADLAGQAVALDVTYDARTRRVAGLIVLGDRQASLRVAGQAVELREVPVLARALGRGEVLTEADLVLERRPREAVPADAAASLAGLAGQVAQRGLTAGQVLRAGDMALPDLVVRGEPVTIVFEVPGIALSLRGIASENGRLGASVAVVNAASKKALQARVVGPGRVSVGPLQPSVRPLAQIPAPIPGQASAGSGLN